MNFYVLFALVILGLLFIFPRRSRALFPIAIVGVFSVGFYYSYFQYQAWQADPLGQFLLPPHRELSYFAAYAFVNFLAPYLVSFIAAFLLLAVMKKMNDKRDGVFFEKEEPYIAATALFLTSHPGWLIYLAAIIFAYLILHVFWVILRHEAVRLPLYRLWVPVAFFVILLNEIWLSNIAWWQLLRI